MCWLAIDCASLVGTIYAAHATRLDWRNPRWATLWETRSLVPRPGDANLVLVELRPDWAVLSVR